MNYIKPSSKIFPRQTRKRKKWFNSRFL